jgi:hypothetical protein
MTSDTTINATSSPGSEGGPLRCDSLGGLTITEFGQALAPANLSAQQAKDLGYLTSGIYGQRGSISSHSANLQWYLESRLMLRFDMNGSIWFQLTWKVQDTPSHRQVCLLRASARRTFDNDCGSWATPNARDYKGGCMTPYRERGGGAKGESLSNQAAVMLGAIPNGSPAETVRTGQLNPEFSLWLMGYPTEWGSCAPQATPSSRKSRQRL